MKKKYVQMPLEFFDSIEDKKQIAELEFVEMLYDIEKDVCKEDWQKVALQMLCTNCSVADIVKECKVGRQRVRTFVNKLKKYLQEYLQN